MKIIEVTENKKEYLDLLLLADEQENMVDRYLDNGRMYILDDKQRWTRGYKRYKETSGLIEWKECQIFHSIFT